MPRLALLSIVLLLPARATAQAPGLHLAARQPVAVLPMDYDGHIFVTATVNGLPARLLLDPVAGLMLDRQYAQARPGWYHDWRELGMQGPTMVGGGGGAEVEVTWADSVRLQLGSFERFFPRTVVIPLDSMMGDAIHGQPDGLFGTGLLRDYAVHLDFANSRLELFDPATVDTTGWQVLPLTFLGARATTTVEITIADTIHHTLRTQVDLGMAPAFRVTTRETNARHLLRHAGGRRTSGRGLGGNLLSVQLGDVTIRLGELTAGPMEISLAREPRGADADPPYDALMGLGLLSQFDVIYDPSNARLLVRERKLP